jgi:hypothetical protein
MSGDDDRPTTWTVNSDLAGGGLLVAIATVALVNARDATFNVWSFPRFTAIFLAILGTGLMIKGWLSPDRRRIFDGHGATTVLPFAVGLIAYGVLFSRAGFVPTTIVAYAAATWVLRRRFTLRSAAISLVIGGAITLVLHQVFIHVFYVPLPDGTWWQSG